MASDFLLGGIDLLGASEPWQAYHDEFPGLELEDGGGRGTAGVMNVVSPAPDLF